LFRLSVKKRSRREKEQRRCILPRFEVVTQLSVFLFGKSVRSSATSAQIVLAMTLFSQS
jgi:hypothetical protein